MRLPTERSVFFYSLVWTIATSKRNYIYKLWIAISFLWFVCWNIIQNFWCLIIYKPFYQATVYKILFSKTFLVTNSDQLQFFPCEFINHYKLHNYKLLIIFFSGSYWRQIMFKCISSCRYYSTRLLDKKPYKYLNTKILDNISTYKS